MRLPDPGECHPVYKPHQYWILPLIQKRNHSVIQVPFSIPKTWTQEYEDIRLDIQTLTVKKMKGRAAFTDFPYEWRWSGAVDSQERWVCTEAIQVWYVDYPDNQRAYFDDLLQATWHQQYAVEEHARMRRQKQLEFLKALGQYR